MTTSFRVKNEQAAGYGHGKAILLTQYQKPNNIVRQVIVRETELSEMISVWDGCSWTIEEINIEDIPTTE